MAGAGENAEIRDGSATNGEVPTTSTANGSVGEDPTDLVDTIVENEISDVAGPKSKTVGEAPADEEGSDDSADAVGALGFADDEGSDGSADAVGSLGFADAEGACFKDPDEEADVISTPSPSSSRSSPARRNNRGSVVQWLSVNLSRAAQSAGIGSIGTSTASAASGSNQRRVSLRSSMGTRSSSLTLRKVPEHILLGPDWDASGRGVEDLDDDLDLGFEDEEEEEGEAGRGILQRTCLRPQFSLRKQLMLSFGIVSTLTVLFVVIVSVIVTISAGHSVKRHSQRNLEEWAEEKASSNARYVSEAFAPMLPGDVSEILRQVVRDRFVGYPDAEGYEADKWVPFPDMISGTNKYPIDAPPLPLDWQIGEGNVNDDNFEEHVGQRREWYGFPETTPLSTANAYFLMQGACDADVTDPGDKRYHANCTAASNNVTTGGAVAPSPTASSLYSKGKDLGPILKTLYESTPSVKTIAMLFANGGAGAGVLFPHTEMDGTTSYTSIGCEWMHLENPYKPGEPIGTEEDIARCHPENETVVNREYNVLERGWCRDQALTPDRLHLVGPYLDAWSHHLWLMTVGQAVYDRMTKEFIGCILLDISVDQLAEVLEKKTVKIGESSLITLVRWDDGTVVSSSNWDSEAANHTTTVDDPKLGTGVSKKDFFDLKNVANFSSLWDPTEVRKKFKESILKSGTQIVSTYPVPPPPQAYDESYRPEFMVIVTLEKTHVFKSFYDLGDKVNQEVRGLIIFTAIIGFGGMFAIVLIIFAVSVFLTRPLQWMRDTSDRIISNFGNDSTLPEHTEDGGMEGNFLEQPQKQLDEGVGASGKVENLDVKHKPFHNLGSTFSSRLLHLQCAPKTELSDLTREFQRMVSQFSSEGTAAKAVRLGSKLTEVRNHFAMQDNFKDLYESRNELGFKYHYGDVANGAKGGGLDTKELTSTSRSVSFDPPKHVHFGPNILSTEEDSKSVMTAALLARNDNTVVKSPLFRFIVGLVVTPLLAVTITITAVVAWKISTDLTELDSIVQEEYIDLENQAATTAVDLRAIHVSEVMRKASRDLHLLSRYAGWLLFDGLNRTSSFTSIHSSGEECKMAGARNKCDHLVNAPCDCAWNDVLAKERCLNDTELLAEYPKMADTRFLQELFFEGQRQNAWPNGDRNYTPVPFEATAPNKTAFWDDPLSVPGHERGPFARGFETTYDRLRVISAASAIAIPVWNYDVTDDKSLTSYYGFEADGMMVGYGGCGHPHANYPFFNSSEQNGAADLRPDLCPLGKHGYDARCRGWYHEGKKLAESEDAPLYVTPPYIFAGHELVAQSATVPLADPHKGELVGVVLLDFMSSAIFSSVTSTQLVPNGFPILLTNEKDGLEHDTVIGPNFTLGKDAARVEEVVIPRDWSCSPPNSGNCSSNSYFNDIAKYMRAGQRGNASFVRMGENGKQETMYISYAPVNVTSYRALDHSDFSRGIKKYSSLVYSLAFVQPKRGVLDQFSDDSEDIKKQVRIAVGVLAAVIVLASAFLVCLSARVTMSITAPILHLLTMIRNVNRLENKEDFIPPTDGSGSCEVSAVYDTFSMLFKVIRFANSAFFSGDTEKAYLVLVDALRLFRSLDNKKAIGVASNNLGNCMLTMYRTMEETKETQICGLTKVQIIAKGTAYFRDAIKLGEEAYDKFYEDQGWSGSCLVFMQHLSSRYFNRAIFFLTVKQDHKYPEEANRLGFRDLDIAKNMDVEVVDQCLEVGFSVNKSELFELMLSRIRGVLSLMEMDYPDEWGIEEQIGDALRELKRAVKNPSSDFFSEVSPAGRMQGLDAELIRYARLKNRTEDAARIGIRMLTEDEYAFHYALSAAVEALADYVTAEGDEKGFSSDTKQAIAMFQNDIEAEFEDTVLHRISDAQKAEENKLTSLKSTRKLKTTTRSVESRLSCSIAHTCRGDFTMEVF